MRRLGFAILALSCIPLFSVCSDNGPSRHNDAGRRPDGGALFGPDGGALFGPDGSALFGPDGGRLQGDARLIADSWLSTNQPACNGTVYACSDGVDNDGDGLVDSADFHCIGPCDDDEAAFATGIPGDNIDACRQDCFFDGNSGAGDDGCEWHLGCDPAYVAWRADHLSEDKVCKTTPTNCPETNAQTTCQDTCLPLTPNGCDCYGCCEVFVESTKYTIYMGCTASDLTTCPRCTLNDDCVNDCGECELCLGKTIDDLPASCFTAPPRDGGVAAPDAGRTPSLCAPGVTACPHLTNSECGAGQYCLTGCCVDVTIY